SDRAKALDNESKNAELEHKTEVMNSLILEKARMEILLKMKQSGKLQEAQNTDDPEQVKRIKQEFQERLEEKIEGQIMNYTSMAEKWANHTISALSTEFGIKELASEALSDLLISSRIFFLVDEDNSKIGFNVEEINPKNVSLFTSPDKKYSKDAYGGSIIQVMEMSEIIDKFDLTKKEIDHLRKNYQNYVNPENVPSNYGTNNTGSSHINYYTGSSLKEQELDILRAELDIDGDEEDLSDILVDSTGGGSSYYGYRFLVVRSYWIGKKLIKRVKFIDPDGIEQTVLADENYEEGTIPTEISVDEGWINQMYKGYKIGDEVYNIEPLKYLNYLPIIGGIFDGKNSAPASLVDMMKNFQVLYNIVVNQIYSILGKDKGKVFKINYRRVPIPKEGNAEDAVSIMLDDAKERGVILEDDSPDNAKGPIQNTQTTQAIDLDLSQMLQTRIMIAQELKLECWELVGFT